MLLGRWENVEDAAAHRDLAAPLHQVDPVVGDPDEPVHDLAQVGAVTDGQRHRFKVAEAGDLGLQDGPHRRHHNRQRRPAGAVGVGQPSQHGEAQPDGVGPRGQPFVRQGLPAREHRDRVGIDQARQRRGEIVGLPPGGGDGQHRPAAPDRERGGGERAQRRRGRQVQPGLTDRGDRACQGRIRTRGGGEGIQQRGEGHRSVRTSREQRTLQTNDKLQTGHSVTERVTAGVPGCSPRDGARPTSHPTYTSPAYTTAFSVILRAGESADSGPPPWPAECPARHPGNRPPRRRRPMARAPRKSRPTPAGSPARHPAGAPGRRARPRSTRRPALTPAGALLGHCPCPAAAAVDEAHPCLPLGRA